jgi:tetratricopeptide (TPR) repeat protein
MADIGIRRGDGLKTIGLLLVVLLATTSAGWAASVDQVCDVAADYTLGIENYPAAIRLHLQVLAKHPDNALAHYHLGFAYGMTGDRQAEIREYATAVKDGLHDWDVFLNLGLAYLERGDTEAGIAALKNAVSQGPRHYETHFDLGIAYERAHRLNDALGELSVATSLNSEDPELRNMHAIVVAERGDLRSAREEWIYLTHTVPDYLPAYSNLAILNGLAGTPPGPPLQGRDAYSPGCASEQHPCRVAGSFQYGAGALVSEKAAR